jgi:putative GTP pyrophosphokinase
MKYKKKIQNEELIRSELKSCADVIASVDLSMQTIRDLIYEDELK